MAQAYDGGFTESPRRPAREGDLLWQPGSEQIACSNLTTFLSWLEDRQGRRFEDYTQLWRWSVDDIEAFWEALWDYFQITTSVRPTAVLGRRTMPGAEWFPGARLNFAEHVLRRERAGEDAVVFATEITPPTGVRWEYLAGQVRILATRLRDIGIRPGDRVVGYLPNIPETMVAMLASASIGAIWASCSPELGARDVLARFRQLEPAVLVTVDGYRYAGNRHDRSDEVRRIAAGLPGLRHVIHLPYLDPYDATPPVDDALNWDSLLDHLPVPAEEFSFKQVPFDHPLWVLFSSGTTGRPKPIVHGHGGVLLEQLKLQHLHMDLRPGDRAFFYTTTDWMMWNFLSCAPLLGAVPVLYDGSPTYPDVDVLWRLAQDAGATFLGTSPSYIALMRQAGVVPGKRYDMSRLREIMPAGSPVSAEVTAWFYDNVKPDVWIATGSGGTDCCTGFVGGVPTLPVYAGEIQARSLGVAAHAFDRYGNSVVDEVGELVITEPMPSMPVAFWGDDDGERYRASYFDRYPGVWRHGDFFRVNARGGCFVLGRSDAILNRHGVRIGTAEVYHAVEEVDAVADALVVNLELPNGGFFMPLFVALREGWTLDAAVEEQIRHRLRTDYSPRHVPDRIVAVPAVPRTLTNKKMEVPVRRILLGESPDAVADRTTMADPDALDPFVEFSRTQLGDLLPAMIASVADAGFELAGKPSPSVPVSAGLGPTPTSHAERRPHLSVRGRRAARAVPRRSGLAPASTEFDAMGVHMERMRTVRQQVLGGPEVLTVTEVDRPEPGPTEILVGVHAAGVNPVDWKTRASGSFLGAPPFTVGWDVSGTVAAVGPGVTRFQPGDAVFGMPRFPAEAGAYAEYATGPSRHFARKPDAVSHADAAALPLAGLTAWQALVETARVEPGQRVLVHAAAGGVGHLAVQVAKAHGAYVLGTASAGKHPFVHQVGADEVIDYTERDFAEAARDVDVVLDTIGGDYAERSLRTLRPGGMLISLTGLAGTDRLQQVAEAAKAAGARVAAMLVEPDRAALEELAHLVDKGLLRAHVSAAVPLDEAARAHELGESGRTSGKIVLTVRS